MTEYDKKIKEIKDLCKWANDHQQEIIQHDDAVVLAVVYDKSQRITNMVVGRGENVTAVLEHLVEGALNSQHFNTGGVQ